MTNSNWGGRRSNQTGRPPVPEEQRRVKVTLYLAPGIKEMAQRLAAFKGYKSWGHLLDEIIKQMAEELI